MPWPELSIGLIITLISGFSVDMILYATCEIDRVCEGEEEERRSEREKEGEREGEP